MLPKKEYLKKRSKELNKNLARSEKWFQELYKPHADKSDLYNEPYHGFIPDLVNKVFRYAVEIDGSIHNRPEVKSKDIKKDLFFIKSNTLIFRIKAYDIDQFNLVLSYLKRIRTSTSYERQIFIDWLKLKYNLTDCKIRAKVNKYKYDKKSKARGY